MYVIRRNLPSRPCSHVGGTVKKIEKEGNQCIEATEGKRVENNVVCILESNGHKYRAKTRKAYTIGTS